MPSLKQLEQFQKFMRSVGREEELLAAQDKKAQPFNLPENEPEPLPETAKDESENEADFVFAGKDEDFTPDFPAKETKSGPGFDEGFPFDFGSFVEARPAAEIPQVETPFDNEAPQETAAPEAAQEADAPEPETPPEPEAAPAAPQETAQEEAAAPETPPEPEIAPEPEAPQEAEETPEPEAAPAAAQEAAAPETPQDSAAPEAAPEPDDDAGFNLDDLSGFGDISGDEEPQAAEQTPEAALETPQDSAAPEAAPEPDDDAGFNLDDLSGFGDISGDEEPQAAEQTPEAAPQTGAEEVDLSGMDLAEDFDIPSIDGISEEEQSSLGVPESEITPDEKAPSSLPDEAAEAEVNLDDLSGFGDISGDEEPQAAEQAPEAAPQAGAEEPAAPGNDEADPFDSFNLAGADAAMPSLDSFDIPGVDAQKPAAQEAVVEEFKISEANLEKLLATLETYPLNVRIACEEIIAEQVIPPEQLNALTKLLISKGTAHEAARLASKILKYRVAVPKGYKTGEELEEEQATFSYIFIHKFFPIIRLCFVIMLMAACVSFLIYQFVYKPIAADILYRKGYELIQEGDPNEYQRANQHFRDAFSIHRVKEWFYKYAELYRDEKQFRYAREKYDELLFYYPHDKKGALDYAALEANWLHNYEKADRIVRTEILDYKIDDHDGLIALGDINLDWAEIEPSRYEEARAAYARVLELYGWTDDVLERMLLYFIRTDKLFEVLPLKQRFMTSKRSKISAMTLAELGGYLLDKRLEPPEGVPDENIERIEGIKDILIRAEAADPSLPEPHYHLARYYNFYGNPDEERWTLEAAARAFDGAKRETPKRVSFRIDNQRRLAASMTEALEFIPAENELVKGINIYEDAVTRGLVQRGPQFGRLYADMGDLEYFAKDGALENAARYYLQSEANGYMPPEIEYRLANTYYHGGDYEQALNRFFNVSRVIPFNRRLLYSMGNTALENKDYFAAEAYYRRLLDRLNSEIARLPGVLPDDSVEHRELIERRLWTQNNLAVTLHELSLRSGRSDYKQRSLALFAEAIRSNDVLERDQATLIRPGLRDPQLPGTNLPYLNLQHVLYPTPNAAPQIYPAIDSDVIEPSRWELRMQRAVNALVKRN